MERVTTKLFRSHNNSPDSYYAARILPIIINSITRIL